MTRQPAAAISASSVESRPSPPSANALWSASATHRTAATSAPTPAAKMARARWSSDPDWKAGVRVEVMELRVVQVAALGWRPRRVGCYSDDAPVGVLLLPTVFREALPGLPNAAMSMPAASALVPDRGVDVRFRRHSGSLSNYRSHLGVR